MSRWLKIVGRIVGVLLVLVVVAVAVVYGVTERRIHTKHEVPAVGVPVTRDSATIARGKHLTIAIGKCGDCHGDNLAGITVIDDPAMGRIMGANLTGGRGSRIAQYTDAELVRVIRR